MKFIYISFDSTLRIWIPTGENQYSIGSTLIGHSDYVMTVTESNGILFSSGQDSNIIQWGENALPIITLEKAHTSAISSLSSSKDFLIAGSWDQTASIWDISSGIISKNPSAILRGHTNHIDAVQILPNGNFLTGSRDHSIRIWSKNGNCIHVLSEAHSGSVRGICVVPKIGFATVGSDGLLRLWTIQGVALSNWIAHDNIIYHISYIPESDSDPNSKNNPSLLVTSSEDQTIKIWGLDGTLKQTFEFPACIWQTAVLQNGDIAVACADSKIYIVSKDDSRTIPSSVIEELNAKVKSLKEKRSGVDISKLEDVSVLNSIQGSRSGEHKVVNDNGQAMVYIWNGNEWEKFGSVVDDPNLQKKEMNSDDGKMYDRVWKVEVSDGVQLLLGYNFGDDPVEVAILFCQNKNLPSYFVNEIVEFIRNHTGQDYKPDTSKTRSFNPYQDNQPKEKSLLDLEKEKDHFPVKIPELISSLPSLDAVINKIKTFNTELQGAGNQYALTSSEFSIFESESKQLSSPDTSSFSQDYFSVIEKFLLWPDDKKFASLDIIRVVLLSSSASKYFLERFQNTGKNFSKEIASSCLKDSSNYALQLMGLRNIINLCKWKELHSLVLDSIPEITSSVFSLLTISKDPVRVTLGRLLFNLSIAAHDQSVETKLNVLHLITLLTPLYQNTTNIQTKNEMAYDYLRAIGTLCLISVLKAEEEVCHQAKLKLSKFVTSCDSSNSVKVQAVSYQLSQVFSAI